MNGTELRTFSHFQILTIRKNRIPGPKQKSSNWLTLLWKSVKMIKFKCKDDLQVSSWWMEKN